MSSPAPPKPTAKAPTPATRTNNSSSSNQKVHSRKEKGPMNKSNFKELTKKGDITFYCHIILSDGTIIAAGKPTDNTSGGSHQQTSSHPDQTFFRQKLPQNVTNAIAKIDIIEIITDCSTYPCSDCFTALPGLIRTYFSIPLKKKSL